LGVELVAAAAVVPVVALALTWSLLAPYSLAREELRAVGVTDTLVALPVSGSMMLLLAGATVAAFVARDRRAATRGDVQKGASRHPLRWMMLCGGIVGIAVASLVCETVYGIDVPASLHGVLAVVGVVAWSIPTLFVTVWVGSKGVGVVAATARAAGRLRGPVLVAALAPSVAAALVLTAPDELRAAAPLESGSVDRIALATTGLLKETSTPPSGSTTSPSSGSDAGRLDAEARASRYTVEECLEDLVEPRPRSLEPRASKDACSTMFAAHWSAGIRDETWKRRSAPPSSRRARPVPSVAARAWLATCDARLNASSTRTGVVPPFAGATPRCSTTSGALGTRRARIFAVVKRWRRRSWS
jgi:hypothetical protein